MNKKNLLIVLALLGLVLIVGLIVLTKSISSLKEYENPVYNYTIKYPSSFALEEKQQKTDSGELRFILLNSTKKSGIYQIYLTVIPKSVEDLEFYENFTATNPNLKPKHEKVNYGILEAYEAVQAGGFEGQEAIYVQVFDKERGYWIRYEIDYDKINLKAKEDAIKITNQILSSFRWLSSSNAIEAQSLNYNIGFGEYVYITNITRLTYLKHLPDCTDLERDCAQSGLFDLSKEENGISRQLTEQFILKGGDSKKIDSFELKLKEIKGWGAESKATIEVKIS